MIESKNNRSNKREYWQEQIKKWGESNLSQSEFCRQSGLSLSTFGYWQCLFIKSNNKNINKFAPIKIIKDEAIDCSDATIQIKLLTGHVVHLPVEMGIPDIIKLIQSLGLPHA